MKKIATVLIMMCLMPLAFMSCSDNGTEPQEEMAYRITIETGRFEIFEAYPYEFYNIYACVYEYDSQKTFNADQARPINGKKKEYLLEDSILVYESYISFGYEYASLVFDMPEGDPTKGFAVVVELRNMETDEVKLQSVSSLERSSFNTSIKFTQENTPISWKEPLYDYKKLQNGVEDQKGEIDLELKMKKL